MPVFRALNLDASVLGERNHNRQRHDQYKPVGVGVSVPRPDMDEIPSKYNKSAEQVPEQHHLVPPHTRHKPCEHIVVIRLGNDAVDHGHEHVRHGGTHGEEQIPDLQCDSEHRHRGRTGHSAQQEVWHVVVHQVEDLVEEDPEAEHRDGLEHRPFQPFEGETHAKRARGIPDVHQQQHAGDGQLRAGDTDRAHAQPEQKHRQEWLSDGSKQLSGLLEHKLFVRHDVGVKRCGQQLDHHIDCHDPHKLTCQHKLTGSQAARKEASHINSQCRTANQAQQRHYSVDKQEHAIETTDAQFIALRFLAHVEAHVRSIESGAQQREREHHGISHLEHAIISLPNKVQQQRHVNDVYQILRDDVRIPKQNTRLALAVQPFTTSCRESFDDFWLRAKDRYALNLSRSPAIRSATLA